jgi:hypothetical protein
MSARPDFVYPPEQRALLFIDSHWLPTKIAGSVDKVLLDPLSDLRPQRRPRLQIDGWHHKDGHEAVSTVKSTVKSNRAPSTVIS